MHWRESAGNTRYVLYKLRTRVLPNVRHLTKSRIRTCSVCLNTTLILATGEDEEFHICVRCRANQRYEMLARYLRHAFPGIQSLDVLELDPDSPLRPLLGQARRHIRSFFRENVAPGFTTPEGVVCQDITRLTYPDESLDLVISSDVLEHVPDPAAAFRESARVLRRGGAHLFTVPPRGVTRQRATLEGGKIRHLVEPEYHLDPLDRSGVLVFWDYGPDMPGRFATPGLEIRAVAGPEGRSGRVVWAARKF